MLLTEFPQSFGENFDSGRSATVAHLIAPYIRSPRLMFALSFVLPLGRPETNLSSERAFPISLSHSNDSFLYIK